MIKLAINGFGRIGKSILRALLSSAHKDLQVTVINVGFGDLSQHIHLLKYDSNHGRLENIKLQGSNLYCNDQEIALIAQTDPSQINWSDYGVDIVLECTGLFATKEKAKAHLKGGVKKVIVSAPCENADATIVYKINDHLLSAKHEVISIGSCTTNCLAPVAKVLDDTIGIERGFVTTVHAYTNDQVVLDTIHKDPRRARSCAISMIPTSTGAAKALSLVLPQLSGKLDGTAIRVPTPNVSLIDLVFTSKNEVTANEVNSVMKEAASGKMKDVLSICDEPLVSVDFKQNCSSSIFDITQTKVVHKQMIRVLSWYDNEWGFSNRMLNIASIYGNL